MTIEGLTAIGLAPPAEGIPPPQGAALADPFGDAFAAAVAANAGNTSGSEQASTPSTPAVWLVDPGSLWLGLPGTPMIEGAPAGQGAVDLIRLDRAAGAEVEDAAAASMLALAGLLGLQLPVVEAAPGGASSGANGDATAANVLVASPDTSVPVVALEVTAGGDDAPAAAADTTGIQASSVDGDELSLPKPEAGVSRAAVAATRDALGDAVPSNARTATQSVAVAVEGAPSGRPAERLGEQLQDVAPAERSEIASAWNRAGGRWNIDAAADFPDGGAEVPAIEVVDEAAPSIPATEVAPDGVEASTVDESGQALAVQARTEATATAATSAVEPPIEAGDERQLVRGLAETVQRAVRTGDRELRLVLNPPELGHLDVRIEHGPQGVRIALATESAGAHDLIQQHLPALRAALEARDLRVERIDVQTADSSSNLGDGGDETQRRQDGDDAQPRWSSVAAMERNEQQAAGEAAPVAARGRDGGGLLDLVA